MKIWTISPGGQWVKITTTSPSVCPYLSVAVESPKLVPLDYAVDAGDAPPPSAQSNREAESEEGDSKKERREEKTPITIAMQWVNFLFCNFWQYIILHS